MAEQDFELRLISVAWQDRHCQDPNRTWVSRSEIPLETEDGVYFTSAITTHPRFFADGNMKAGQFALRVADNDPVDTPVLEYGGNSRQELSRVQDRDGIVWWIEMDPRKWDAQSCYYGAYSHTTAGEVTIFCGVRTLQLEIYPALSNARTAQRQYDLMRHDFLDGLSYLIANPESPVMKELELRTGSGAKGLGSATPFAQYNGFIRAVADAVARPRTKMMKQPGLVAARRAGTDPAVLRQLAVRPNARVIEGNVSIESVDTPENRYLIGMLHYVQRQMRLEESVLRDQVAGWKRKEDELTNQANRLEADQATSGVRLKPHEKADLKRDQSATERERAKAGQHHDSISAILADFESLRRRTGQILPKEWCRIKPSLRRPGSAVFSGDPYYARVLKLHRGIKKNAGRDYTQRLEALHFQEFHGIEEWQALYERWCLLRILRLLLEDFGFQMEEGVDWKELLLTSYMGGQRGPRSRLKSRESKDLWHRFRCSMTNAGLKRRVEVYWERELDVNDAVNYLCPDFTLRLFRTGDGEEELAATVIMDAKSFPQRHPFCETAPTDSINPQGKEWVKTLIDLGESKDLFYRDNKTKKRDGRDTGKNYRNISEVAPQGTNCFFLLHPSEGGQKPPHDLAPHFPSYYGGEPVHGFINTSPNHRTGSVIVTVSKLHDLKRLLIMCLQYIMEEDHAVGRDPEPSLTPFCISCGDPLLTSVKLLGGGNGRLYTCPCEQKLYVNRCVNSECLENNKRNRLYKYGRDYTFHGTILGAPYNIVCPNCGTSLANDRN